MSNSTSHSVNSGHLNCYCGDEVALVKSWTSLNPGRRFFACRNYDPVSKSRGCRFFKWHDIEQTNWQRKLINDLMIEKKELQAQLIGNEAQLSMLLRDRNVKSRKNVCVYVLVICCIVVFLANRFK